jgi:hypothetical protein
MKTEIERAFGAFVMGLVILLLIGFTLGWGWAFAGLASQYAACLIRLYNKERARHA